MSSVSEECGASILTYNLQASMSCLFSRGLFNDSVTRVTLFKDKVGSEPEAFHWNVSGMYLNYPKLFLNISRMYVRNSQSMITKFQAIFHIYLKR
jgi:hypothetical protein